MPMLRGARLRVARIIEQSLDLVAPAPEHRPSGKCREQTLAYQTKEPRFCLSSRARRVEPARRRGISKGAILCAIGAAPRRIMKIAPKAHRPNRRTFLAGATLGGSAMAGLVSTARSAPTPIVPQNTNSSPAIAARAALAEADQAETARAAVNPNGDRAEVAPITISNPGSDFMVDVIKSLDLEYVALNPGGSSRGLHESIIHYGGNSQPSLIAVNHEEIAVAIAHGYARAAGKPMGTLLYAVLGLQHASMAVYNAFADRVPIMMFAGNVGNENKRFGPPSWYHSATDLAALLPGYLKWSDQPVSPHYIADAFHRSYRQAVTPPQGPVLTVIDDWLQESSFTDIRNELTIPAYHPPIAAIADPQALAQAARVLVGAQYPVIVADRTVSSQAGMDRVAELTGLLGAAFLNGPSRICLPTGHPLNLTGMQRSVVPKADVILFLGVDDMWEVLFSTTDTVTRPTRRIAYPNVKTIALSIDQYDGRGNIADQMHALDVDLSITGDPEASLPHLIEAVKRELADEPSSAISSRATAIEADHDKLRAANRQTATFGWDASPVSVARLTAELSAALDGESWSVITNSAHFLNMWPQKLWDINRWNQFQMASGAGGLGFTLPSAIGAALALKNSGTIPVAFQTDGDFMYVSSALWTAAHHRIRCSS
jgi:acetolactate synthase I/II/III large subunit